MHVSHNKGEKGDNIMEFKDLELLANIHNALMRVETKGESTIILGQCLSTLKNFVETKDKELKDKQ